MPSHDALFDAGTWERALERYGAVTRLTASVYDRDRRLVCGPRPSTPLFAFFETHGFAPGILAECVQRSLTLPDGDPDVTITRSFGLAVVGTPLRLDGQIVGAAVAGYALVDFSQASAIESLAHHAGLPFRPLWQIATQVQPVPERRLTMQGQLLSLLGDTILTAHDRTRQVEDDVGHLEQRVEDRTVELRPPTGRWRPKCTSAPAPKSACASCCHAWSWCGRRSGNGSRATSTITWGSN